jgi:hypothetical protein
MIHTTKDLLARRDGEEPLMVLTMPSYSSSGKNFTCRGKHHGKYIFTYDHQRRCYAMKIPLSVWEKDNCAMGKDIFDVQGNPPIVPTIEIYVKPAKEEQKVSGPQPPLVDERRATQGALVATG